MTFFVGIDIGGTKIAAAIVSDSGLVTGRIDTPTPVKEGGPRILEQAIALARTVIESSPEPIKAIGIGAGGQIDAVRGTVFSATDVLPGWRGLSIVDPVEKALGLPARVDNDVNVLAFGEKRFGAARQFANGTILFLALGTGVGGALLVDGKVHHGAHWSGGEFGHILLTMQSDARRDLGGAAGTLESFCSGPGLVQTWRELSGSNDDDATGESVVQDADENLHGSGSEAITKTGEYLGFGLVTLTNALDPDLVIIGGGLASLGERLLEPARRILKERALPGPSTCPVVVAELGHDAALVGAASLVM